MLVYVTIITKIKIKIIVFERLSIWKNNMYLRVWYNMNKSKFISCMLDLSPNSSVSSQLDTSLQLRCDCYSYMCHCYSCCWLASFWFLTGFLLGSNLRMKGLKLHLYLIPRFSWAFASSKRDVLKIHEIYALHIIIKQCLCMCCPSLRKWRNQKIVYEVVLLACISVNRGSRGISLIGCYLERTWRICFPSIIISSAIMGNMKVKFLPFLTQLLTCSCMLHWRKTKGIKRTVRSWILLRRNT